MDSDNEFKDYHTGYRLNPMENINATFNAAAILEGRVGYMIEQEYESCGVNLGSTEIYRRYNYSKQLVQLKKKNNL